MRYVRMALCVGLCILAAVLLVSCWHCEHTYGEWVEVQAPTCLQKGGRRRSCTKCGVSETEPLDALGHMFLWVTDREPTEDHSGSKHEECVRCAFVRQANVHLPPLGHTHTVVDVSAKAPTCTEAGHEAYVFCTSCYRYFTDITCTTEVERDALTSAPLGHSFTDYKPNGDATEEQDGTKTAVCDREGCNETETVTDSGSILLPSYTVTFYGFDGVSVISRVTVRKGDDAVPPVLTGSDALNFLGWQGSYTDVTEDCSVYAIRETRANVFILSSATASEGEVTLTLSVRGDVMLCGAELRLLFDSSFLTLVRIEAVDASVMAYVPTDDIVRLNVVDDENRTSAFDLLTVTFRVSDAMQGATTVYVVCDNCILWQPGTGTELSSAERCTVNATVYIPSREQ